MESSRSYFDQFKEPAPWHSSTRSNTFLLTRNSGRTSAARPTAVRVSETCPWNTSMPRELTQMTERFGPSAKAMEPPNTVWPSGLLPGGPLELATVGESIDRRAPADRLS